MRSLVDDKLTECSEEIQEETKDSVSLIRNIPSPTHFQNTLSSQTLMLTQFCTPVETHQHRCHLDHRRKSSMAYPYTYLHSTNTSWPPWNLLYTFSTSINNSTSKAIYTVFSASHSTRSPHPMTSVLHKFPQKIAPPWLPPFTKRCNAPTASPKHSTRHKKTFVIS